MAEFEFFYYMKIFF